MTILWKSDVTRIGGDAAEMIEAGVLILFGEPVPDALADVSVVHAGVPQLTRELAAGDQFIVGDQTYIIQEFGERACANLNEIGHVVVYVNQPDQQLLPGAVKVTGPELQIPAVGSELRFIGA